MLYGVVTTIQPPTESIVGLVQRLHQNGGKLVVAGDKKGPAAYDNPGSGAWPVKFLDLNEQLETPFKLARLSPTGHYARKNIGYLWAIAQGATCIYETDDDNVPNESWRVRAESIPRIHVVPSPKSASRWINIYGYFSEENIWPRGLPLDETRRPCPTAEPEGSAHAPVQQGLVNGSPDVDAIWRLILDRPFEFEAGESVFLDRGNWCPFNTQSTWWWPVAYPLLYIPSYCSFRMCDIWKSFVAQRCLWELGAGVAFHAAEVVQDRNLHDLMRDFQEEIPGYQNNRRIAEVLMAAELRPGQGYVSDNLRTCYECLVEAEIFPARELELLEAWRHDLESVHHHENGDLSAHA